MSFAVLRCVALRSVVLSCLFWYFRVLPSVVLCCLVLCLTLDASA